MLTYRLVTSIAVPDRDDSSFGMMFEENIVWPPFVDGLKILIERKKRGGLMWQTLEKEIKV